MNVALNYVNRSKGTNNPDIVVFAKNAATGFDEVAVAWLVIRNCGQGDNHPFTYPMAMTIGASDSYGNYTRQLAAQNGQLFLMVSSPLSDALTYGGAASSNSQVELRNDLAKGAIDARIFKDGRLFALKSSVAPKQKAVFQFKPTIWIGVASQVEQGSVVNSAIVSSVNTEISLLGIASADIVMTGGGQGAGSTPFVFALENVVMA